MCFLTSWFVLLCGVPFSFTPWGFLTGLFMVPGGTAGYFAVRNAGLAVSQGIWASLKVLVAFAWGIFVFDERLRSYTGTATAVAMMLVGLVGMSYYATPQRTKVHVDVDDKDDDDDDEGQRPLITPNGHSSTIPSEKPVIRWPTYRHLGLLAAIFDGVYGGTLLVPMHYSDPTKTKGLAFVLSFSIGCSVVVMATWVLRYLYYCQQTRSFAQGWERLPSFFVSSIGPAATLAGFIWSIGNVCSILSVAMLGQGVGYSIIQSQLLVAGLFGVFYYGEIRGASAIASWFLCACLTVLGIVLLSREHISEK